MGVTKIEWTSTVVDGQVVPGYSFNPWRGCSRVSEGCRFCYAETMSRRNPSVLGEWGDQGKRVVAAESYWKQPLKWNREAEREGVRRKVFCLSMGDVFEDRPELVQPRVRLFHLISETPNLDWLLLTKRPENIRRFHGGNGVPRSWTENMPPNVWLGVSVEDQQRADERIPLLLQTPAAVRFLSVEPLLDEVNLRPWFDPTGVCCGAPADVECQCRGCRHIRAFPRDEHGFATLDWVICGGESGPNARPFLLEWAESLRDQCREAGVPYFLKQLGSCPRRLTGTGVAEILTLRDPKGGSMDEWPEGLRVRQFPEVTDHAE